MVQLLIGSFLLSLIHALIPTHWAPVIAIARSQQWTLSETVGIALLTGLAHSGSTILLGILLGLIGFQVSETYQTFASVFVPLLLIGMGLVYVGLDLNRSHHGHLPPASRLQQRSKVSIILTLCLSMLFSPCLEIETYYFKAGTYGWLGIGLVSVVYLVVTVSGMVLLVALGYRGLQTLRWDWLEHHEKKMTGSVLILLGLFAYFFQ